MHAAVAMCLLPIFGQATPAEGEAVFDAARITESELALSEDPAGAVGYITSTLGGEPCVATDGQAEKHWLVWDAPDEFASYDPIPVTVVFRYYDQPAGLLALFCDAQDNAPGACAGPQAEVARFMRTGQPEWRTAVYRLTHPRLTNRTRAAGDIGMTGFTESADPRAADIAIARVMVTHRTMDIECSPDTVASDADDVTVTVTATCHMGPDTPAPDGAIVRFSDTAGDLEAEATTEGGIATVSIRPPAEAGWETIWADWDGLPARGRLCVLDGPGPTEDVTVDVESFDLPPQAPLHSMGGQGTTARASPDIKVEGDGALRIDYAFDPQYAGVAYFDVPLTVPVPDRTRRIRWQMHGDASEHLMQLRITDAEGEPLILSLGKIRFLGWEEVVCPIGDGPCEVEGVDVTGDQEVDFPIMLRGIRILRDHPLARQGAIILDDVRADCTVTQGGV
jgi:hypothetical protein